MSSARDALYDLADQDSQMENEPSKGLTKEDVSSAINDYFIQQQKSARQAEQMERQKRLETQRQMEEQERSEISSVVKKSLQEEALKDKSFSKLVQDSDLPGELIDYIAEVGEADEAPLIVREIASNEEYKEKFKRAKTELGVRRLLSQVRKSILMGGKPHIPEIIKKNIPNYNYNNSPDDYDKEYISDLAMRHGI